MQDRRESGVDAVAAVDDDVSCAQRYKTYKRRCARQTSIRSVLRDIDTSDSCHPSST